MKEEVLVFSFQIRLPNISLFKEKTRMCVKHLLFQLLDEIEKLKKRIAELEAELKEALKYKYKCQVSHFICSC